MSTGTLSRGPTQAVETSRKSWKKEFADRIQDPFQLRVFLTGLMLLVGYVAIEIPLGGAVSAKARQLRAERRRLELVRDVKRLRTDYQQLDKRLPLASRGKAQISPGPKPAASSAPTKPGAMPPAGPSATRNENDPDSNEWTRYVLGGIRQHPLKLQILETEPLRTVGPYKAVVLRIALEGSYSDLNAFLRWLDANERLVRVDRVVLEPLRGGTALTLQLTVLGVMG